MGTESIRHSRGSRLRISSRFAWPMACHCGRAKEEDDGDAMLDGFSIPGKSGSVGSGRVMVGGVWLSVRAGCVLFASACKKLGTDMTSVVIIPVFSFFPSVRLLLLQVLPLLVVSGARSNLAASWCVVCEANYMAM